jgi:RsbT co-antagonist protein rsbRD N-terminal domain
LENSHESDRESIVRLIAHRAFPKLASALRSQADQIVETWMGAIRAAVPAARELPSHELRDHLPAILEKMADVMESADRPDIDALVQHSPAQGPTRFEQRYDVRALLTEDRLLRRSIVKQVELALGRRMIQTERVALDMGIDIMLQETVAAQNGQVHRPHC